MPLYRKVSIGTGLPTELWGLLKCTFYSAYQFGHSGGSGVGTFWDACYVRGRTTAGGDGYYIVTGSGQDASTVPRVLVLSGSGAVAYVTPSAPTSVRPWTGCASSILASNNNKAVLVGGSNSASARTGAFHGLQDASNYVSNGAWMSGTPSNSWPHRVEIQPFSDSLMVAFGKATTANTKRISFKQFNDNTTDAWTACTVPGSIFPEDGYVKGRVAQSGFTLALTASFQLDASINILPSNTNFYNDTTVSDVRDIDHSPNQQTFIMVSATEGIFTVNSNSGWPPTGPISWTHHDTPEDFDHPCWCVALDIPVAASGALDQAGGNIRTWYGIGFASLGSSTASNFLLTEDFNTYYGIELAGLRKNRPFNMDDSFPLNNCYLRYTGNRLFVFNGTGVSISGQLGYFPFLYQAVS